MIFLLHLATFRLHYWKTLKPLIFMISGFSDVSLSPITIYVYHGRDQKPPNNSRKKQKQFWKSYFKNNKLLDFENVETFGKDGRWES